MSFKKMKPLIHIDINLKERIKELIFKKNKYPDEYELSVELQNLYPEYKRKKLNILKLQVKQCLDQISNEESDVGSDDVEMQNDINNESIEFMIDKKPSNVFNSSISELYKKSASIKKELEGIKNLEEETEKIKLKTKKLNKKRLYDDDKNDEKSLDKLLNKQLKIKNKYIKEAKYEYSDFAGIDNKINELKRFVNNFKVKERFYPKDYKSLLIHGPAGVGKTCLVEATANYLKADFLSTVLNQSNNNELVFNELLELIKISESNGIIILIDKIDSIGLKSDGSNLEKDRNIIIFLENFFNSISEFKDKNILIIACSNKFEKLDSEIINLFDIFLKLDLPNQKARFSILKLICEKNLPKLDYDLDELSKKTPGFVAEDYHKLFITAKHIANERYLNYLNEEDLENGINKNDVEEALKLINPASKNEGFANMTNVSWNDIGALNDAKELLKLCILDRVKYKEIAETLKLNKPVGILMYGPPGCGKTLLAKAIANEAEINFISVRGPELLNKFVGESEKAVRELFQRANKLKPCLIFFDEFDSISSCKADIGNDVTTRVMKQLLVEMDGYDSRSCFMLAATNRPDLIDPAILRPGRFNKAIYIGFPNSEERVDILKTITKNGTYPKCSQNVDFDKIGSDPSLNGYSGAELTELVDIATEFAFKRFISKKELGDKIDSTETVVTEDDFINALKKLRPPLGEKERKKFEEIKIKFDSKTK